MSEPLTDAELAVVEEVARLVIRRRHRAGRETRAAVELDRRLRELTGDGVTSADVEELRHRLRALVPPVDPRVGRSPAPDSSWMRTERIGGRGPRWWRR